MKGVLTMLDDDRTAEIAKALGHPARIRIVRMLAAQSECAGAELFSGLPLAQSTISEHLRVLKDAGLVHARPVGTGMVYCVEAGPLAEFAGSIAGIADTAPACSPAEKDGARS
jgi:ArsR family transcriptional regulator, arsenate/arsenite/antimonite-responsive transcriptional repressor